MRLPLILLLVEVEMIVKEDNVLKILHPHSVCSDFSDVPMFDHSSMKNVAKNSSFEFKGCHLLQEFHDGHNYNFPTS